ncbi:DNA ligase 6 isoform X3 [Tanacetum coccineum]
MTSSPPTPTLTLNSQTLFNHPTTQTLTPLPNTLPPHKLIPKTRFIIDGFHFSGQHSISYFLTHFHSDHYSPLSPSWSHGIIYTSHITSNLLIQTLHISPSLIFPLPLSETVLIDGCEVTLVDANHCPGAVQFLFKIPSFGGKFEKYVHTGDFRFCDEMRLDRSVSEFVGCDGVFLDTTYCDPKYVFRKQSELIDYIVSVVEKFRKKKVLFLVATYVIGKEKILVEVTRRCGKKVYVDERKMSVLRTLGYEECEVFTSDESESDVHVIGWNVIGETWPYFKPNFVKMKEIIEGRGYDKVVGFVLTGWTYEVKKSKFAVRVKDEFEIHLVPYSEHSNYEELREYVRFLRPKRVIPTVGVDVGDVDGKNVGKMLKHFSGLVDEMANKQDFLMGFHRGSRDLVKLKEKVQEPEKDMILADQKEEHGSRDLVMMTDKETDEILQELRDCLPSWVIRDQMMDLISKLGNNVVDAVTYFYENETEYHEQVITSTSASASQESSIDILKEVIARASSTSASNKSIPKACVSPSTPVKTLLKSEVSSSGKRKKSSTIKQTTKSPSQKRKTTDSKSTKKPKITSQVESVGPKQCSITKFFTKVSPMASQDKSAETLLEQSQNDDKSSESTQYTDEVDQFIQIINGSESLRIYATTILEEAKGDINKALDLYYTKSNDKDGVTKKTPAQVSDTEVSDKSKQPKGSLTPQLPAGNVPSDVVSLPPEKYSPTDHACWKDGQPAPYLHIARTFSLLDDEKGKIKATSMLCNMFRSLLVLSPEDVLPAVYLCTNKIAPDHENTSMVCCLCNLFEPNTYYKFITLCAFVIAPNAKAGTPMFLIIPSVSDMVQFCQELNIGGSIVKTALEEACGTNRSKIRELYNSLGDVAQLCRQTQKLLAPPAPLSIRGVYSVLREISETLGFCFWCQIL